MGKRARKTRWRALDIADDHSDSEESNTNSSALSGRYPHSYRSSAHHSKYSYSSQSTPARRRYQYDGSTKTTRSSSTTSENKITFNEDEYTRITTPRQDVLFKKGYLNKPKSYQSQTSTGNSTISTGYSTENGTPDHQSTDLDYESQFVFPNGFVDTNGIYYVNSYEPYPLMLINPPTTYYHEFSNVKSKRYSTGSLSESMSPNNEESASQDLSQSGGEASNSVSDYSTGAPVYNMVFPGYYVNGTSPMNELPNGHHNGEPVKKLKKRRERKSSKTIPGDSSENTDANYSDDDINQKRCISPTPESPSAEPTEVLPEPGPSSIEQVQAKVPESNTSNDTEPESKTAANVASCDNPLTNGCADSKTENAEISADTQQAQPSSPTSKQSILKADAEEFIPRAYQPLVPPPHIKMLPPNFLPIPLVSINDFAGPNFNHHAAFIPSGFPINFIPHHPGQKMYPPVPGFVNFVPPVVHETKIEEVTNQNENSSQEDDKEKVDTATPSHTPEIEDVKPPMHNKQLDIATVVSKLEEAAKQQEKEESNKESFTQTPVMEINIRKPTKYNKMSPTKKNYYKYRNGSTRNGSFVPKNYESSPSTPSTPTHSRETPERKIATPLTNNEKSESTTTEKSLQVNGVYQNISSCTSNNDSVTTERPTTITNKSKYINKIDENKTNRNSPERFRKNWKPNGYQSSNQNGYGSPRRQPNGHYSPHHHKYNTNSNDKRYVNGDLNKNYSDMLKKDSLRPTLTNNELRNNVGTETAKQTEPNHNESEKTNRQQLAKAKPNQWISVSSRKKKKNTKSFEENGFETDEEPESHESLSNNDGDFETYDISQLVDVVPSSKQPPNGEQTEKSIGDILSSIAQHEASEGQQTPTNIPEVSEIEKNMIIKIEDKIPNDVSEQINVEQPETEISVNITAPMREESSNKQEDTEENFKTKKSKKGTQKPLLKKVIITDIDLSMTVEEVKSPIKKSVQKIETCHKTDTVTPSEISNAKSNAEIPSEIVEQTEKKSKKKKKKCTKQITQNNPVCPPVTVTTPEISYDFLLENSVLNEIEEKTNDEISLELDKLIQKGMYSSLQEKIKSFNTENDTDKFFMDLDSVVSPKKENVSGGNGYMKAPDFNRIFQSTRQFLKPNMALPIRALDLF